MSVVLPQKENVAALKASEELIGQGYPVLVSDRSGRIVSGENRKAANSNWRTETRHYENEFEEQLARIELNTQKKVPEEEMKVRFGHLAEAAMNDFHIPMSEVCAFLVEKLKHRYTGAWIRELLDDKFKGPQGPKKGSVSDSTHALLDGVRADGKNASEAVNGLTTGLALEKKTYSIMAGCLCSGCPNKDECF